MSRREFPAKVRLAVIKRCTDTTGTIRCEECHGVAKRFEIDHIVADQIGGQPTAENAKLLCVPCHREKTAADAGVIAKAKRQEAKHLGAVAPKQPIKSAPLPQGGARKKHPIDLPPRRSLYAEMS